MKTADHHSRQTANPLDMRMRKLTLNILQPVGREKLRPDQSALPCSLVCAFVFFPCSVCNFVFGWVAGVR